VKAAFVLIIVELIIVWFWKPLWEIIPKLRLFTMH